MHSKTASNRISFVVGLSLDLANLKYKEATATPDTKNILIVLIQNWSRVS